MAASQKPKGDMAWIPGGEFRLAVLVAAAVHVFLTRKAATLPKWMGKLETASPGFAFKIGLLLFGLFPPDILTSIAVGSSLAGCAGAPPGLRCPSASRRASTRSGAG